MPCWYKSPCCILATGLLPSFPLHLLYTSAIFGLLSRLYGELQSNMTMLNQTESPGRLEGDCEEDTAWLLDDLPGQGRNQREELYCWTPWTGWSTLLQMSAPGRGVYTKRKGEMSSDNAELIPESLKGLSMVVQTAESI